jgi:hypothetical protein
MVKVIPKRRKRYLPRSRRKPRSERSKTFLTETAAKKWAEDNGIKNYEIKRLNFGLSKKVQIVEK